MVAVLESNCPQLKLLCRGKVRDLYELQEGLLFVATDRISAFDVILKNGIENKGKLLTQLSLFWFHRLQHIIPNHLIESDIRKMPASVQQYASQLDGRSLLVRKLRVLPIEAIVRGYLSGSAWKEYKSSGTVNGIQLPPGLQESDKLQEPLFTPSTKAELGKHDENIHPSLVANIVGGQELADEIARVSVQLYREASEYASERGIIIADTKFEFGIDDSDGQLYLIDEALTPDSSRFWEAESYQPGRSQDR